MQTEYDEGGSIGKRYRRQDEIGTPWCVTVDHQSLEDRTVTVRDRDSLEQERVAIDELPDALAQRLAAPWRSPKLGARRYRRRVTRSQSRDTRVLRPARTRSRPAPQRTLTAALLGASMTSLPLPASTFASAPLRT